MAAMISVVLVIRWLSVAASALPLNLHLPRRYGSLLILTWGGLRGGLSIAMALSLPDGPTKAPMLTIAYGIVVFSIVVQGLTLEPAARRALVGSGRGNRAYFCLYTSSVFDRPRCDMAFLCR